MYEWPVTQPISAAHHQTSSSGFRSKTQRMLVSAPSRNPPDVWTMPFGFAVVPDV